MCACVAVPAAEVARSPAATRDIEVGAVSPVPPATSAPLTAINPPFDAAPGTIFLSV